MTQLFQNHQLVKMSDEYAALFCIVVYAVLLFFSFRTSFSKKEPNSGRFLNPMITNELKGLAIMLVVIGHIGFHALSSRHSFLILSDFGVSLFFILSGYGLAASYGRNTLSVGRFLSKRLQRVMIPYWIATILIFVLDYLLLQRTYDMRTWLLTLLGINLTTVSRQLDYVRWFITLQLIWYGVFVIVFKIVRGRLSRSLLILTVACLLEVISYYRLDLGYAFLSFPFGVFLGLYGAEASRFIERIKPAKGMKACAVMALVVSVFAARYLFPPLRGAIPSIVITASNEMIYIVFAACLLLVQSRQATQSAVLGLLGLYSYEIFLFHGIFMIKYDFILFRGPLVFTFWFYLLALLLLSALSNKAFDRLNTRLLPAR